MKTTVVPAQVTTVEDKIVGNLSFTQLLLMTMPVFLNGAFFALMPPVMNVTIMKIIIGAVVAIIGLTLAIRIKDKLVAQWLGVMVHYAARPRYYLYNKNDPYLRKQNEPLAKDNCDAVEVSKPAETTKRQLIPTPQMVQLETAVADPRAKFHLKATKGGLRVYIREIKEESL